MEEGLTTEQAEKRTKEQGGNSIVINKPFVIPRLFLSQFITRMNGILLLAAIFSLSLGHLIDGFFILAVILVNGLFSFFQEYHAQKALEKLATLSEPLTKVLRDHTLQQVPISDIVGGDILKLQSGDSIPADCIVLASHHLEVDESLLTGESVPVIKEKGATVYRGTYIAKGTATLRVQAIGLATRLGQLSKTLAQLPPTPTPLQKEIDQLSTYLSLGAIILASLILPIGLAQGRSFFPVLLVGISIAVAAIPESLPGVITIALAVGMNALAKKGALVRKMVSVETLATTDSILTDKTGTITENNMRVKEWYVHTPSQKKELIQACLQGNTAVIADPIKGSIIGDKTDGALLLWAQQAGKLFQKEGEVLDEYEFDEHAKTISTVIKRNNSIFVYTRGAPEEILQKSMLSQKERAQLTTKLQTMAKQGLRVIGFGYKKEQMSFPLTRKYLESHLEFLGFVGIYDAPRPQAKRAIEEAQKAGVRIIMVTGDNPDTALQIAKEVGLATTEQALTGAELAEMSDEKVMEALKKVSVFARTAPEDKLRLTKLAQQLGWVVGVTGDGINDALALEAADVGVAMGDSGTDVAREAADIVLENDDIYTLVRAVKQGRIIYENILKALTYLLAGNLSEILFVVIATIVSHPLVLLPTQILWINLVTDAFPALALAQSEQAEPSFLKKRSRILSPQRILWIFLAGAILATIYLATFSLLLSVFPAIIARTVTFNVVVLLQLGLALVIHGKKKLHRFLWLSILVTVLAQAVISFVPVLQHIFYLGW